MDQYIDSVKEFLSQHPKTKQELYKWYKESLLKMQNEMTEGETPEDLEVPDIQDEMIDDMVPASMIVNHRFMYEFFDERNLKVFLLDKDGSISYQINGDVAGASFSNRVEAEQDAFKKCFSILEKLLSV